MITSDFALLYDAKNNKDGALFFYNLIDEIICTDPNKLTDTIEKIEFYQSEGYYLVGLINFEAGFLLDDALEKYFRQSDMPLIAFKVFKHFNRFSQKELQEKFYQFIKNDKESFIYNFKLLDDYKTYQDQFKKVQNALKNGETYQINLTSKYQFQFLGNPLAFYFQLIKQQSASYTAFLDFGRWKILSISPELFFKKENQTLICKPMKGTVKRHQDPEIDAKNKSFLANDLKNKTENVIIVDLLRNDLARISETGSVSVPKLFEVETFETVYQMTSTIQSTIKEGTSLYEILKYLFPCGSITGAPKISTMKHIAKIETSARNLYTGSIGYLMPDGDMSFNVAIRTLVIDQKNNTGELGVGGGITISSDVQEEWEELQLKATFVRQVDKPFDLIECLLFKEGNYQFLDKHLNRLSDAALDFSFEFDRYQLLDQLETLAKKLDCHRSYKIRVLLKSSGVFDIQAEEALPFKTPLRLKISQKRVNSSNVLLRYKTTSKSVREFYDTIRKEYQDAYQCSDVIFINEKGYVTESSIFNVVIKLNGVCYTPKVTDGVLPGIMRAVLLEKNEIIEKSIAIDELLQAEAIYVINSVRGMIKAELMLSDQLNQVSI